MKKLKHFVSWLVQQAVLGALIWYGVVKGVEGAANCALVLLWMVNVSSWAAALNDEYIQTLVKRGRPVPEELNVAWDALVIGTLVWNGWTWTGVFYLLAMLVIAASHDKADKLRGAA